jgi:hypothetical protein
VPSSDEEEEQHSDHSNERRRREAGDERRPAPQQPRIAAERSHSPHPDDDEEEEEGGADDYDMYGSDPEPFEVEDPVPSRRARQPAGAVALLDERVAKLEAVFVRHKKFAPDFSEAAYALLKECFNAEDIPP